MAAGPFYSQVQVIACQKTHHQSCICNFARSWLRYELIRRSQENSFGQVVMSKVGKTHQTTILRPQNSAYLLTALCGIHFLIWSFLPLSYMHNLHSDTTELIYWGHALSWGYPKHPPLAAWILEALLTPGDNALIILFLFSQLCVTVTAVYLWLTLRLLDHSRSHYLGIIFFLAAPTAGLFALQINHNSILQPFWIAFTYHSLRYFKQGRARDALLMFVIGALGFLVKYQIILLFLTILTLALAVQSYRSIFLRPITYMGLLLFVLIISPHLLWLVTSDNSAVDYALNARRAAGLFELLASGHDLVIGFLTVCTGAIMVGALMRLAGFRPVITRPSFEVMALACGPILFLVIGALLTAQDIRQGWMLPFTTTILIGVTMTIQIKTEALSARSFVLMVLGFAVLNNALLFGFMEIKAVMGKPIEAFDFDARPIAQRVEALWRERSTQPLRCLVIDSRRSSHVVLWLASRPMIINVGDPYWSRPQQIEDCLANGGVAILHENTEKENLDRFCLKKEIETSATSGINKRASFPQLDLFDVSLPKDGADCLK